MSKLESRNSIAYITLNGRIPSTAADSVAVVSMCEQFAAQGLDVTLLLPGGQGASLSKLGNAESIFEYYAILTPFKFKPFPNLLRGKLSKFSRLYSLALVAYLKKIGCSLITARSLEAAVWAARLRMPVILESHNYSKFAKHPMIKSWVSFMKDRSCSVSMVVTTVAGKNSYISIGVPEDRIIVLPNGVNVERFHNLEVAEVLRDELGLPKDRPLIAFCGSLHEGRGVEEMLDCAKHVPEAFLVIVGGDAGDVLRYINLANQRGLDNVCFVGHVNQMQLPKYLMASDVLLMPYSTRFSAHTFEYTSPMKMFEYLASGKPIVVTDFPVLHEVLTDEYNAIFVEPDSGEELARGVRKLLDNPDLAMRIGKNARVDAERYSWKERAAAIIKWQKDLGNLL